MKYSITMRMKTIQGGKSVQEVLVAEGKTEEKAKKQALLDAKDEFGHLCTNMEIVSCEEVPLPR